jgi:hypothetical protein
MQTNDSVARFVALRASLLKEREALHNRLQQIETALGSVGESRWTHTSSLTSGPRKRGRPPRSGAGLSIREAIAKVTARQPMGLSELVDAVQRIGYRFESKNPRNSVGAYLYSPHGRKYFKRANGKFSPIN